MSAHYKIIVQGLLHQRWWPRFKEMEIYYEDKNTVLSGTVISQDLIQKTLSDLRNMHFKLILVEKTDA